MRITQYHAGVPVIPKSKIKEAAEKLASYEDLGEPVFNQTMAAMHKELIELSRTYLKVTNELIKYQSIGTIEELQEIRNKAIDEFAKALLNSPFGDWNNIPCTEIKRIAEQMKERLENESK